MYNMLIVDDEEIEREGIAYLIEEYKLPFCVVQAENGKKAIEYLQKHNVDVLFTDIKMPYMDGLELANKAKEMIPDIKIIIYSAYGDFEYAKKAISLNVVHYILKPIIIQEFIDTMSKITRLCEEEEHHRKYEEKLKEGYNKSIVFEKQRLFLELLNTEEADESLKDRIDSLGFDYAGKRLRMVMVDFRNRFFDTNDESFRNWLDNNLVCGYDYINLNERQSIILLKADENEMDREDLSALGEKIKNWVSVQLNSKVCIIIGRAFNKLECMGKEYDYIEHALDYKFFFDESVVLLADSMVPGGNTFDETVNKILDGIYASIELADLCSAEAGMEKLFGFFRGKDSFSAIYVKYICTEMAKKVHEKSSMTSTAGFSKLIDRIFESTTLQQLKDLLAEYIRDIKENGDSNGNELNKKVIRDICNYIHENYMKDISLESIADEVYLSSGYLSGFFKKETGQSLVKYITSYRMERAKELLQNTNMKIIDISEKVGYSNTSYFCTAFKSYLGVSPAKYRGRDD